jgi:folylpolyglutamate synthase/dihydropteroate synthase
MLNHSEVNESVDSKLNQAIVDKDFAARVGCLQMMDFEKDENSEIRKAVLTLIYANDIETLTSLLHLSIDNCSVSRLSLCLAIHKPDYSHFQIQRGIHNCSWIRRIQLSETKRQYSYSESKLG